MAKKGFFILAVFILMSGAFGAILSCDNREVSSSEESEFQKATLVRVVDGDTLKISVDGENERCRLVGINCPEAGTEEGDAATAFVEDLLTEGQVLYLQKDVSETDRYERLLRYVWLEIPDRYSQEEVENKMLNAILIKEGYAEVRWYAPDTSFHELFENIQNDSYAQAA